MAIRPVSERSDAVSRKPYNISTKILVFALMLHLRRITAIFDAISAVNILAFAVNKQHNIRQECGELWIIFTIGRIGQN
jgi:hypothetical protein